MFTYLILLVSIFKISIAIKWKQFAGVNQNQHSKLKMIKIENKWKWTNENKSWKKFTELEQIFLLWLFHGGTFSKEVNSSNTNGWDMNIFIWRWFSMTNQPIIRAVTMTMFSPGSKFGNIIILRLQL